ncbi:MAG TPA: patatin-like phospholipase family protein [Desulfuromonadales bacterium]|nr:patatin-like phospholipase family protein [Desulfuromonadales bacterium]
MPLDPPPKIGLALGSGAARGLAHIGVLKVLDAEQIPIHAIAGTSIGAFIGALYAAGVSVAQMEEVARNVDWRRLARLVDPVLPTSGLLDGHKMEVFMTQLLPVRTFEELRIPLAVIATDVETGEELVIRKGDLQKALRAAVAFPGIFTPVSFAGRFLVDGGLCNPVPIDAARALGADKVIGVCAIPEVDKRPGETFLPVSEGKSALKRLRFPFFNAQHVEGLFRDIWRSRGRQEKTELHCSRNERRPPGIFRIFAQSIAIMENQINALRLQQTHEDLLLRPKLNNMTLYEFHRAEEAIRAGETAAKEHLAAIRALASIDCSNPQL